jgi:hypothetical protein
MGRVPCAGKEAKEAYAADEGMENKVCFLELPYWKLLRMPHSLDLMHITKNVCKSLLGTLLNMLERTKDGPKARNDLRIMGIRSDLHGGPPDVVDDDDHESVGHRKGKKVKKTEHHCPPSCFTLSQEEIKQFLKCLLGVKFPYGYVGKISRYLDEAK